MDLLERLQNAGLVEKPPVEDQVLVGLRKYCVDNPNNEIAKRWLKQLIDKKDSKVQSKVE